MWFATDGGLNKYDGYTFKIYKNQLNEATTIGNDFVLDLAEDREGSLWLGTASGLDNFDQQRDIFLHYRPGHDININDVLIDKKNNIWLGTTSGLYLFDKQNKSFTNYAYQPTHNNCLSNNHIYHLAEDNVGRIWIATKDGLNCFNPITRQFVVYKGSPASNNGLQTTWVRSVYKDHEGIIWIGTIGAGVARFDSATQQFVQFKHDPLNSNSIAHNDVLSFAEDSYNNLWIGTENGGISVLNNDTKQFTTIANDADDPQSLSNNSVYALYKDDIGNMWAGTWANGACMLPVVGKKFNTYTQLPGNANSLSNPSVLSIMMDEKEDIWIGTDGGGLNRFNIKTKQFTHYMNEGFKNNPLQNNFIISVIKAGSNLLALGYHRGSIDIFNTITKKVIKHISIIDAVDKKFELSANCLFMDRANNLWVGTWGGGVYMLNNEYKIVANYMHSATDNNSINSDFINCIMQDKEGALWFGTDEGLNKLNSLSRNFIQYRHNLKDQTTISHNEINDIFEDKSGRLWIGSAGGLDLLDKQKAKLISFTKANGLPSNAVQAIEEDANGTLWLSTDNGIAAFNPTTKTSRNYSIDDGLQGPEFKNNCSFLSKDGLMFFGGNNGFNFFRPDSLRENPFVPPVYITDFQLFNKSQYPGNKDSVLSRTITETEQITLSYKQSVISFEFAALNFSYSDKNQYAYMLEGFDKDWIYAGTHRSATYTNLDAGGYTFKVKASNNDGVWNEKGTSIRLVVTPPFWKTWWFYLLAALAVAGMALLFVNYRIKTIHQQKIILQQQVKKQTALLVKFNIEETAARIEAEKLRAEADDANKKLTVSNQQMEQFAYVASHDLKEPLRTTTSFINLLQKKYKGQLDEEADKYIYFITNAAERMKVLIDDLLQFSRIGSNKTLSKIDCNELLKVVLQDIDVAVKETNSTVKITALPVINGYATELKLLFQNLLVNALKFRKKELAADIMVAAEDKGSYWQFSVKDNGIGIAPEFKEKIFMIFQRLHGMAEYEGSGIGLAHCHKIVGLHNGKIWVESEPRTGSVFYFTIAKNIT